MNRKKKKNVQMSEAFVTAIFLTLSGGFQDAYTYCFRGKVFANAQTGNIVLMSGYLAQGQWKAAVRYAVPLLAFTAGIIAAEYIQGKYKYIRRIHWRQMILLFEIIILFGVGLIPQTFNIGANALVSFACAMQVQTFRKVNGSAYASTMCIGNLRTGSEALCRFLQNKDKNEWDRAIRYFSVIILFAVGAGLGVVFTDIASGYAIWVSCALLLIGFGIMFIKEEEEEKSGR